MREDVEVPVDGGFLRKWLCQAGLHEKGFCEHVKISLVLQTFFFLSYFGGKEELHLTPSLVRVESSSKYAWFLGSVSMAFLQSMEPVVPIRVKWMVGGGSCQHFCLLL